MIHMGVDDTLSSLPPSYRGYRNLEMNTGKRARSPEDAGSDRPSKKPTLSIVEIAGRPNARHLSVSSGSSSRQTSEDWVQQTGGLTIDSPLYAASDPEHQFTSHSGETSGDVDMVMDSEESSNVDATTERFHLSPLHTSPYSLSKPDRQSQDLHPTPHNANSTPRHHYGTRYAERMHGPTIVPMINILPATPVSAQHTSQQEVGGSSSALSYSLSQPSTPPPSDVIPMAISPVASFAQLSSPVTPKRRVVFGPRSNCEKCRAGERHFIHYE